MKNDRRVDLAIICLLAFVAVLAIITSVITINPALRLIATIGGILLGPGVLAYRVATGSGWIECLTVGIGANVAILMMLGMFGVTTHYWHPVQLELLIPLATFLLAVVLFQRIQRKEPFGRSRTDSLENRDPGAFGNRHPGTFENRRGRRMSE